MKVAIVSEYPRSAQAAIGGVQVVVRRLAVAMAAREGVEIHVVSFDAGLDERVDEELDGVLVHRFPATKRFGNLTLGHRERRVTVEALREIAPDVANSHVLGPQSLGTADSGFPWVATAHGIQDAYGKTLRPGIANRVRAWSYTKMERMCLRRARHLIVINPHVLEYFGDLTKRLTTYEVENPVADVFFTPEGPRDPTRIVFSGRVVPLKNPEVLLDAAAEMAREGTSFELRLVGPADDPEYVRALEQRAARHGIAEHVRFLGAVPPEKLAGELASAGVLVLPSRQETASVAIMEGMAAGLPVVATNVGGTRHLVEEGVTGALVEVGDTHGLARRLSEYVADPERARSHGGAGRRVAEDRFRIEKAAECTLEVYRRVLAAP